MSAVPAAGVGALGAFAPGDIFLGCTLLNDPTDDHAGPGRILQFDEDLRPKGELYTEGGTHLVGGLAFGPGVGRRQLARPGERRHRLVVLLLRPVGVSEADVEI